MQTIGPDIGAPSRSPALQPLTATVSEGFRVPKRQVPVRLTLAGQPPRQLWLYLAERAERHAGGESPSDLLNEGDAFIPARDADGKVLIFRRSAIMVVSVSAEDDSAGLEIEAESEQVTTVTVELSLQDGTRVCGELAYWRPEGQRRVQDYLNSAEHFVPLRDGDLIHLVNRNTIVSLSQI